MTADPIFSRSQVTLKTAFTVCFAVVATLVLVTFAYLTRYVIALTLVSALIAVALDHVVGALVKRGVKLPLARALVILALLGVIAGLAFLIIPPLVEQVKSLAQQAPEITEKIRHNKVFDFIRRNLETAGGEERAEAKSTQLVQGTAKPVLVALGGALSVVSAFATILFLSIFILLFGGGIIRAMIAEARPDRRERYHRVLEKIYQSVGGYILGLLFICTTNAVLTTTFLAITRMPYFLALGVCSGFSSLVPYAGPIVAGLTITLIALATGGIWKAIATAIYFVAYGQLEGQILGPVVLKRTAQMNPLLTLVSVLFFWEVASIAGAVLAVPAVATFQIILRELLAIRRDRLLGGVPGAQASAGAPVP